MHLKHHLKKTCLKNSLSWNRVFFVHHSCFQSVVQSLLQPVLRLLCFIWLSCRPKEAFQERLPHSIIFGFSLFKTASKFLLKIPFKVFVAGLFQLFSPFFFEFFYDFSNHLNSWGRKSSLFLLDDIPIFHVLLLSFEIAHFWLTFSNLFAISHCCFEDFFPLAIQFLFHFIFY